MDAQMIPIKSEMEKGRLSLETAMSRLYGRKDLDVCCAATGMSTDVTVLLQRWKGGDRPAFDELIGRLHGELRRTAGALLRRERRDHTLQPTALVNEAYTRLLGHTRLNLN